MVRYCCWLTHNVDVAEDLASETLLEAWRNAHKLTDGDGLDRWLAAIARNVCLRWRRQRGRDVRTIPYAAHHEVAAKNDLESAREWHDLSPTLARALEALPPATRAAFLLRHLADASQAEIAEHIGTTESAVSMRLSRARAQLRHALQADTTTNEPDWRETRLWCSRCGTRRQQIRFDTEHRVVSFRCPGCDDDPRIIASEMPLTNPYIARMIDGLRQPAAISRRIETWVNDYFRRALDGPTIACTACGAQAKVGRTMHREAQTSDRKQIGMHVHCQHCGTICSSSLASLVMSLPEVSAFCRVHGRVRTLPLRQLEIVGQPAVQMTIESVTSLARLDVLSGRDTFAVLGIHPSS